MTNLREFILQNRFYLWLLVLIFIMRALVGSLLTEEAGRPEEPAGRLQPGAVEKLGSREEIEKVLVENRPLAGVLFTSGFLMSFILFLGVILNVRILLMKKHGREIIESGDNPPPAVWGVIDIGRAVVILTFLFYLIVLAELLFFAGARPRPEAGIVIDVFNSAFFDIAGLAVVFYFVAVKYRQKLPALGLTLKKFFTNISLGVVGYVAVLPALLLAKVVSLEIARLTGQEAGISAAVDIFWAEERLWVIFLMAAFVCLLGPLVEEVFFRGFVYGALRNRWGVAPAAVLSAGFFAFLHLNTVDFLPILILGLLLAYVYEKTGSLYTSIAVHVINNSVMVFFLLLFKSIRA